jgi:hypothetical protein
MLEHLSFSLFASVYVLARRRSLVAVSCHVCVFLNVHLVFAGVCTRKILMRSLKKLAATISLSVGVCV